jgi:general secretion pathway protein K
MRNARRASDHILQWPRAPGYRDRGFILILVLGACLVLAMIAAVFSRSVQVGLRDTSLRVESARAEALADAGLALAARDLRAPRTFSCEIAGTGRVFVSIEDEAGRVDLNSARESLMLAILEGLGVGGEDGRRLFATLADYQDPDSEVRADGAEAEAYRSAEMRTGPRNAPLESVDELDRVVGWPADIRTRLKPLATVYSGLSGIDPEHAAQELIDLLAPAGATLSERIVSRSQGRTLRVTSLGVSDANVRFVRVEVLERTGPDGAKPLRRLWTQGEMTPTLAALQTAEIRLPPC